MRIVASTGTGAAGASARRFSFRDFADYRERTTTIEDLSGVNLATFLLEADNRTDQLLGEIASGRYLSLLGARAVQGRLLVEGDDAAGAPPVAVISDALWRRRFGGEPVVGRTVLLNRTSLHDRRRRRRVVRRQLHRRAHRRLDSDRQFRADARRSTGRSIESQRTLSLIGRLRTA